MPGNYGHHIDRFGFCQCKHRSGIEMMDLESEVSPGRYQVEKVPACADCFGLI